MPPRTRDVLLALLAGAAGCVDALSYLRLGNVFTANMTGNAVLLGIGAGEHVAARALHSAAALGGFVLGALAGAALCGRREPSGTDSWPPRVTVALTVELAVLAVVAGGWALVAGQPAGRAAYGLILAWGAAMGVQSAAVQRLRVGGVATTYVTGTITGLLAGLARGGAPLGSLLRPSGVLVGLVAGAVVAAVVVRAAAGVAAVLPVVLLAAVVAVAAGAAPRRPDRAAQAQAGDEGDRVRGHPAGE